jgi:hypothetical protein
MRIRLPVASLVGLVLLTVGAFAEEAPKPDKEQAVKLLKAFLLELEAKDYNAAAAFVYLPEGITEEEKAKFKDGLPKMLENREISAAGIAKLSAEGKWGSLAEVAGQDRATRMAAKFKVPIEQCFGLYLDSAEAGFYWDGKSLKIIRCDDIGKLSDE